jgi:hypothetical protein
MSTRTVLTMLATVVAVVVGVIAWRHSDAGPGLHDLSVSDQTASQVLAGVPVPAGFNRSLTCGPRPASRSICFHEAPSQVLTSADWAEVVARLGVALTSNPECSAPRRRFPGRPTAINCLAFGRLGGQQLTLTATSVVEATPNGLTPSSAEFAHLNGTSIVVIDAGS